MIAFFSQLKSQVWGYILTISDQKAHLRIQEEKHRHNPRKKRSLIIKDPWKQGIMTKQIQRGGVSDQSKEWVSVAKPPSLLPVGGGALCL